MGNGEKSTGLPLRGKVMMLQEWRINTRWWFWPKQLIQPGVVPWGICCQNSTFLLLFCLNSVATGYTSPSLLCWAQQRWGLSQPTPLGSVVHLGCPTGSVRSYSSYTTYLSVSIPNGLISKKPEGTEGGDLGQGYAEGGGREERCLWTCRSLRKEGGQGGIWEGQ